MSYQWKCDAEASSRKSKSKSFLTSEKVDKHPLESTTSVHSKSKGDFETLDPLSITELDPLSRMAADDLGIITVGNLGLRPSMDNFEPWSSKKTAILNKFTTKEKLSLTTSYFAAEHDVRGVSEKVLHRLEQLDLDVGSKQYFGGLSQDEYINKISQLDHQLTQAWQADLRVNALKITIQCCKLLGDTNVISFYPSKFVIITDILDKFGDMVYNRLLGKQSNAGDMLPPEVAKETCKNWFFKVGSIRELLPRVSIEMAILKSYSFISQNPDYGRIFGRLLNSMWGIGDPVVAIYLRCYICRKAMELISNHKELYMQCFQDLLLLHDQILENFRFNPQMSEAKVIMETYMNALSPAVDWILQCLVHRGEHLNYTIQLISNVPPFWKSVLMRSVLNTFPPNFIGDECLNIIEMILTLESNLGPILKSLGMCLIVIDSPQHESKEIWKRIWPQIKNIHRRDQYLECCEVWVEFMVKNFGSEIVNLFIEDLLDHLTTKDFDQYQGKLVCIIEKLLTFSNDISVLLLMDKFIKIVTLLKNKVDVIKTILTTFHTKHPENQNDNILISTLLHLTSLLHDSIDALSPADEVKQIGNLINGVILKVNYGRDFEKQLQFYDEARGSFSNNDIVLYQLVQCVNKLGMDVKKIVGGHHTKRTKSFLCACIAYSFITIPSIESYYLQLQLYLLTAQVSYGNQNVSQGNIGLCQSRTGSRCIGKLRSSLVMIIKVKYSLQKS